jgi:hypothetical protein
MPEQLPAKVQRAYLQAEANFPHEGHEEAAGGMYRRALDIGTKIYAAQKAETEPLKARNLGQRIEGLAAAGRLTRELADWAHEVRLVGNEAMHELDEVSREDLIAMRGFAETALTYMFTLPAMLEERRKAARGTTS